MVEKIRHSNSWANVPSAEPVKKLKRRKESKDPQPYPRDRRRKKKPSEDAQSAGSVEAEPAPAERENPPDESGGAGPAEGGERRRGRKIDIRV